MISRRIFAAVALLCAIAAPAHAQTGSPKTAAQLNSEINSLFQDNSVGGITPTKLRQVTLDQVASIPFLNTAAIFSAITINGVNTSYYVAPAPTGNDSNSCLTAITPCLTLQGAGNKAAVSNYGLGGATIQLADGAYSAGMLTAGTWTGAGPISIIGNNASPGNVFINVTGANAIQVSNAFVTISGVKLQTALGFGAIVAVNGGDISFSNVQFAGSTGNHMTATKNSRIHITGNYSIIGGGQSHYHADVSSLIETTAPITVTLSGTPAFSAYFAGAADGGLINLNATFAGTGATGPKFLVHNGGRIFTGNSGLSYFPGDAAGAFGDTWGQYDGITSGVNGLSGGAPLTADTYFTGNANSVAMPALSSPSQFHAVGANNTAAGYACDAVGTFPAQCLDFSRFAFGTGASPAAVTGSAYVKTIGAQAYDSTGNYGTIAAIDLLTANSQTGTDHGGLIVGRVTPPGSVGLAEVWRASAGFMIGTTNDMGAGTLNLLNGLYNNGTAPTGTGGYVRAISPALTGAPTTPTAAVDTNTTQIASTAMVLGQAASATPLINGSAAVGTSTRYARGDHVHPTDTSRAPLVSPSFTTPALGVATATSINGVTIDNTAWTSYTPTVTGGGGSCGACSVAATGRSQQRGKTMIAETSIAITSIGSWSGSLIATLPATSAAALNAGVCFESSVTGKSGASFAGGGGSTFSTRDAAAGSWWVNGYVVTCTITYELP